MLPIVVDAVAYGRALHQAERFADKVPWNHYRQAIFYPAFTRQMAGHMKACFSAKATIGKTYRVAVTFGSDKRPYRLVVRERNAYLDCYAQAVAGVKFPLAPAQNFVELIETSVIP